MGVDTKGVVLTNSKDVLVIASLLEQCFEQLVNKHAKEEFPDKARFHADVRKQYSTPRLDLRASSGMLSIGFTCFGERRDLKVFFTCDCDNTEFAPKSVSLTLGCWGNSAYFMQSALQTLSVLGPVLYDENDCDDIEKAPLEYPSISLLQAVKLKLIRPYYLEEFAKAHAQGDLKVERTFDEFVGMPKSDFDSLMQLPHEARWDALKALANALPYVESPQPNLQSLQDTATAQP